MAPIITVMVVLIFLKLFADEIANMLAWVVFLGTPLVVCAIVFAFSPQWAAILFCCYILFALLCGGLYLMFKFDKWREARRNKKALKNKPVAEPGTPFNARLFREQQYDLMVNFEDSPKA